MPLFTILTLFPEALESYANVGILGLARRNGLVEIDFVDFRDWARDRHRTVDDRPFGGGPGMVLKPEPIVECVDWIEARRGPHRRIALCPTGPLFRQSDAAELAAAERTLLLCGRYEGFDQRALDHLAFETLSIGEFVLAGGELPALCVLEAATRLIPGALGHELSAVQDSFHDGETLDHPHYTRPRTFRGEPVPDVLMSGDHARIDAWRQKEARNRTRTRQAEEARRAPQADSPDRP
ncbi:MAG: tRNA (guanine37-N1)-methyltransferase [Planctomycetota bacterium]|jgi:tRNA (guanine37-N1)-methyltransferase